jgi:GT2 family glycosyltransferase
VNPTLLPIESVEEAASREVKSLTITVIIVNWNSGDFIRKCLASIRRPGAGLNIRVVVVDNASRDGSPDLVEREFPDVRLIRTGKNLGFGKGNNVAQKYVAPGYVLFLNPDTELKPDALRRMNDFLASHPKTGAVGCKMVFPDGTVADQNLQWFPSPVTEFVRLAFLSDRVIRLLKPILPWNDPLKSGYVRKLYGGCLMVRTSVLEKVGWFDERFFMYAEDVDLSRRILEAGWQLYYLSEAEIMHAKGGATTEAGSDFSTLMGCESMQKLIAKYRGKVAGAAYRASIFGAALFRLVLLLPLLAASPAFPERKSSSWREAAKGSLLRVKWVLGVRSAFVPQ